MDANSIPDHVQDMIDDFAFLTDWEDRYMHVIDLGKALPDLPNEEKTSATRVEGCASQVWLISDADTNTQLMTFKGDSDAHIVRGLVAIILMIYSGQTASQVKAIDAEPILNALGLSEHLSAQRANGLRAMISRIKYEADKVLT